VNAKVFEPYTRPGVGLSRITPKEAVMLSVRGILLKYFQKPIGSTLAFEEGS
jgi:hypothetical protein